MTMVLTVFAEELIKKDIKQLYSVQIYHCVSLVLVARTRQCHGIRL